MFYPAYREGEAGADAAAEVVPAEELAEELLDADALVEDALAEAAVGEAPVGPELMVRTTGALGLASVPAEGSVPVTVPYSSGPCTDLIAATLKPASERILAASSRGRPETSGMPPLSSVVSPVSSALSSSEVVST